MHNINKGEKCKIIIYNDNVTSSERINSTQKMFSGCVYYTDQ